MESLSYLLFTSYCFLFLERNYRKTNRYLWWGDFGFSVCLIFLSDADSGICNDILFLVSRLCHRAFKGGVAILYFDDSFVRSILQEE